MMTIKHFVKKNWLLIKKNGFKLTELVLTAAAIWVAYLLLLETQLQVQIANRSIQQTETALLLTQQSLDESKRNSIIENRAWIGLVSQPYLTTSTIMRGGAIYAQIKNFGKTPAESVQIKGKRTITSKKPYLRNLDDLTIHPRVLSPDEILQIEYQFDDSFNYELVQDIENGKLKMYVYAIITYKDIYGKHDTTEFFSVYDRRFGFRSFGLNNRMR